MKATERVMLAEVHTDIKHMLKAIEAGVAKDETQDKRLGNLERMVAVIGAGMTGIYALGLIFIKTIIGAIVKVIQ